MRRWATKAVRQTSLDRKDHQQTAQQPYLLIRLSTMPAGSGLLFFRTDPYWRAVLMTLAIFRIHRSKPKECSRTSSGLLVLSEGDRDSVSQAQPSQASKMHCAIWRRRTTTWMVNSRDRAVEGADRRTGGGEREPAWAAAGRPLLFIKCFAIPRSLLLLRPRKEPTTDSSRLRQQTLKCQLAVH
jgi:hypothetical protein